MKSTDNEDEVPTPVRRSARLAQSRSAHVHRVMPYSPQPNEVRRQPRANSELPSSQQANPQLEMISQADRAVRRSSRTSGGLSASAQPSVAFSSSSQANDELRSSRHANPQLEMASQPSLEFRRPSRASVDLSTSSQAVSASSPSHDNAELPSTSQATVVPAKKRRLSEKNEEPPSSSQSNLRTTSSQDSSDADSSTSKPQANLITRRSSRGIPGFPSTLQANLQLPSFPQDFGTGTHPGASGFVTSPLESCAPSAVSTPIEDASVPRTGAMLQSKFAELVDPRLPTAPIPVAGTSKSVDEKIMLVPLKESGSLCSTDLSSVDTTDNSAAAATDTTDSSISSSMFVWSIPSYSTDTTRTLSNYNSSSSIEVITDPEDEKTGEEDQLVNSKDDEDEDITDTSNSIGVIDPEGEEHENENDDGDSDAIWTDKTDESEYREEELGIMDADDIVAKPEKRKCLNDSSEMAGTSATKDAESKDGSGKSDGEGKRKCLSDISKMEDTGCGESSANRPSTSFRPQISSDDDSTSEGNEVADVLQTDQLEISQEVRNSPTSNTGTETDLDDMMQSMAVSGDKIQSDSENL